MKAYNIYFNGHKINTKPLMPDTMKKIMHENKVSVKMANGIYKQYNTANIKILECTIV